MPDPAVPPSVKSTIVRKPGFAAIRVGIRTLGAIAPPLAARTAEALFRTPPRHAAAARAEDAQLFQDSRPGSLSVRGAPIASWSWGDGPPVLLVHGWGSRAARLGSFVAPLVAAGHRVVAFDAPGHGGAALRRSSLPEFIFAIEAAHEEHGPFTAIVAHSMGGAATTLAMARGVHADRAVFLAPAANPAGYFGMFASILGLSDPIRARVEERIVRRFGMRWPEFDVLGAASRLRAPLLVVHDETDSDVPFADGSAIAAAWPGGTLVSTRGLGHKKIVHDPAVVSRCVQFVARRQAPAAIAT